MREKICGVFLMPCNGKNTLPNISLSLLLSIIIGRNNNNRCLYLQRILNLSSSLCIFNRADKRKLWPDEDAIKAVEIACCHRRIALTERNRTAAQEDEKVYARGQSSRYCNARLAFLYCHGERLCCAASARNITIKRR